METCPGAVAGGVGVSPALLNRNTAKRQGGIDCLAMCGRDAHTPSGIPGSFLLPEAELDSKSKCQKFNGFADTLIFRGLSKQAVLSRFSC